jgi:choline kinase
VNQPVVCILTAGAGSRMGRFAGLINKALLPLRGEAIISHIVNAFPPQTEFVVALGYHGEQVRAYLAAAHPGVKFEFVEVYRYEGAGSGPGYSLLCCRRLLNRPFYFVASDTLFVPATSPKPGANWAGVSRVPPEQTGSYCNLRVDDGRVRDIRDKQSAGEQYRVFTGFLFVSDHELFWRSLSNDSLINHEHQISNGLQGLIDAGRLDAVEGTWQDLGDYEKYRNAQAVEPGFDFSKTDEFIYFPGSRVVKFFRDPAIVAGRAKKAGLKPDVFPHLETVSGQFYSYVRAPGETLYARNSRATFVRLLEWLESSVWTRVHVDAARMRAACARFYLDKTKERLEAFDRKYPDYLAPQTVNGEPVLPVRDLLDRLPWNLLLDGIPAFIHGDLQFDNILHDEKTGSFLLLDWRQDFAGQLNYGDLYYDLAKLYGGLTLNYDYIKAGLFRVERSGDDLTVDFAVHSLHQTLREEFERFVGQRGFDLSHIRVLLGLIFLNMSPLHHEPFDRALYSLGARALTREVLETCVQQ